VPRPRILLCPQFTEVEWAIAPLLSEWAEVAAFDAPGIGTERFPDDAEPDFDRELVVQRALREVEQLEWDAYFAVGDAWGTATAVRVAAAAPERVLGIALGHASIDYAIERQRPSVNGEMVAAMRQLMDSDYDSFVRYGLTQFTQGGWDEETAGRIVERFPPMEVTRDLWEMLVARPEPMAERIRELGKPTLLVKHDGCLVFTPEGYEDVVSACPAAETASVPTAPSASPEFAAALREFCEAHQGSD
jgi:pimeloyl-ACP methyl ester carboxylesterase